MERSRRPALAETSLFASTVRDARWQPQDEGGFCVVIPAMSVSGVELKKALDSEFRGQYSVQLKRDQYRIMLPHLEEAELRTYFQ